MGSEKINFYRKKLPTSCIDFSSTYGKQIFKNALNSGYMNSYFKLGPQLRTQDEPAYCGLSSLVIILNALAIDPGKVWKGVWRWYHEDMLECCTSLDDIKKNGITIQQLSCIARCNQLNSNIIYADESLTLELFREEVKSACMSMEKALVVSFGRKVLSQTGSGHFTPIGGYSAEDDLVLLLEPARFKYPPFWIKTSLLLKAMQSIDQVTEKPRGYLVLRKSSLQPTILFHLSKVLNVMHPVDDECISFFNQILLFLKQNLTQDKSVDDIIKESANKIFCLSKLCKTFGKKLFFTTTRSSDVNVLSPEHQQAVELLIDSIQSTYIYKLVTKHMESVMCCESKLYQALNDINEESCKIVCSTTTCIICFPHYLTLIFCMLPIFAPEVNHVHKMTVKENEYFGTYLEELVKVVKNTLNAHQEILKAHEEGSYLFDEGSDDERRFKASKLFLNEIDQLQTQLSNILSSTTEKTCCGIVQTD